MHRNILRARQFRGDKEQRTRLCGGNTEEGRKERDKTDETSEGGGSRSTRLGGVEEENVGEISLEWVVADP